MNVNYDIGIIGGGLAGLTLSIQLATAGYKVALFEKESYPYHKVCGEYISMESWDFLERLGLPLSIMNLPRIRHLVVSSPAGKMIKTPLQPGGFGISRYTIDNLLAQLARQKGVDIYENCKVEDVQFQNGAFALHTTLGQFQAQVSCGTFGKRSNIDVKWKRRFLRRGKDKLNNYVGVKYHAMAAVDTGTISLHNFKDGYCGISNIEEGKTCICYLTNAKNLVESGSIAMLEKRILVANPHLENIFSQSAFLYSQPLSISQVSFHKKSQVENHVLLVGDAAGMITPLCGNGMSMAMNGGKIAARHITLFLENKVSRAIMESGYTREWNVTFGSRLMVGRVIQRFFGKMWLSEIFIRLLKNFPSLARKLVAATHGKNY